MLRLLILLLLLVAFESPVAAQGRAVFATGGAAVELELVDVAYDGSNYNGNGSMTWVVDAADQTAFWYIQLAPKLVLFNIRIISSTIGGTASTSITVDIPFTVASTVAGADQNAAAYLVDSGTAAPSGSFCTAREGATVIRFWHTQQTNYTATGADNSSVACQIAFEVE